MRFFAVPHVHGHGGRVKFLALGVLVLCGLAYHTLSSSDQSPLLPYDPTPETLELGHPQFAEVREYERLLPQHRVPGRWTGMGGKERRRYVYFPWEAWGTGWNNVFQEQLLNTHLAYLADRGYVFTDYIARDHPPFADTLANGTRSMLHIPMNAFTSGPTGGGSWGPHAPRGTPRGISQAWWDVVCSEVVELSLPKVNGELGIDAQTSGAERMMRWAGKLKGMKGQCVKVVDGTPFDFLFMVTTKPASIWPSPASYGTSPTLTAFTWSALVTRAFIRNYAVVSSAGMLPPYLMPALPWQHTLDIGSIAHPYPLSSIPPLAISAPPLRGLLALHIRRGDYDTHCHNLAEWGTPYNTWNVFGAPEFQGEAGGYPALPDFHSPTDLNVNETLAHCYPDIDAILEKIHAVVASPSTPSTQSFIPTHIFIATNGDAHWLAGLTHRLMNDPVLGGGGGVAGVKVKVSTSRDFQATMTLEERAVDMAVDMAVLLAAEVFIGNGWSSVTSNVVQLRLAGGREPGTCRFW